MGFMQAYKRLDALCRDMNGIGVTGYIEDMEQIANANRFVSGWKADYQKLKYYRHIRNQIAHEVDATEEELCSPEDVAWIEEFHQRILGRIDPLAVYYNASCFQKNMEASMGNAVSSMTHSSDLPSTPRSHKKAVLGCILWLIVVAITSVVWFVFELIL